MTTPDLAAIVRQMTKASRRALVKIGTEWTDEGSPGPSRTDAYSLWWGKNGHLRLIEAPVPFAIGHSSCRWRYRLTKLGAQVRAHLLSETNDADR
jgi:hypothetical protein